MFNCDTVKETRTHLPLHTLEQRPSEPAQKEDRSILPDPRHSWFLCGELVHLPGRPQSRHEVVFELRLHLEQLGLLTRTQGGGTERGSRVSGKGGGRTE